MNSQRIFKNPDAGESYDVPLSPGIESTTIPGSETGLYTLYKTIAVREKLNRNSRSYNNYVQL